MEDGEQHGCLFFLYHLEDVEFQIIGFLRSPQDGVVGRLGAEIDLAEALVGIPGRPGNGVPEQVRIHKMRAGAGGEETSVLYQSESPLVDFPVSPDGGLDGITRFCEGRRVQDNHVKLLFLSVELREQFENIGAEVSQTGSLAADQPTAFLR